MVKMNSLNSLTGQIDTANRESSTSSQESHKIKMYKITNLKTILEKDLDACDIKWTLFVVAAQSYRIDTCLRPFPPMLYSNDDIDKLLNVISEIPPLEILNEKLNDKQMKDFSQDSIDLLYWVLVTLRDPFIRSVNKTDFDKILKTVPSDKQGPRPSHIFKVCPLPNSMAEEKFQSHVSSNGGLRTNYAFHGSKLDSFHSILNYGLAQHLSKRALFGEGIYLSSELDISIQYSQMGIAWGKSKYGERMSCLALCEYVEHPIHLRCQITDKNANKNDKVPKKYFVVTNNEIVRVRYLMIYATERKKKTTTEYKSPTLIWLSNNKTILTMCLYTAFLVSIGLANSQNGHYLRKICSKKAGDVLEYIKNIFSK